MLALAADGARRHVPRMVVLLVVAASPFWGNPARVNAAEPVGWRPVFSESFNDQTTLPTWCTADDGAQGDSYLRPDEVTVADGELRLGVRRRTFGGRMYTTGGIRCTGTTQQYGRYEFRARAPLGTGIDSAATLSPGSADLQQHASSLRVLARPGDERLHLSNGFGTGETTRIVPGSYSDGFHTYVIEWAPSGFRVFVDGRESLVDARVSTVRRWFGLAVSSADALAGQPDAQRALPAEFRVDYLRVWAYDPAASRDPAASHDPVDTGTPSTLDAVRSTGHGHRSLWLPVGAIVALLVAAVSYVMRKTRP